MRTDEHKMIPVEPLARENETAPDRTDKPEEACGVFGIWAPGEPVALHTYYALISLQHRGQESAGIIVANEDGLTIDKGMGLVTDVFENSSFLSQPGFAALGHVRYSTTGGSSFLNSQPLLIRYKGGQLALAHNGNLVNAAELREELEQKGSIFQSTIDSEVFAHLIARSGFAAPETALSEAVQRIRGGYAIIFLTENKLIAMRDPNGIRPLSLGKLGDNYVVASESCAFDTIGATFLREIEPGEGITIDNSGLHSFRAAPAGRHNLCAFEYIYFARPDSTMYGNNIHAIRKLLGKALALEAPIEADLVTGVPDSSISAAIGYAEASGIPYEMGLIKNRYMGRTFIKPTQEMRQTAVRLKLNPVRSIVEGKRVLLVDDSIVRGTTTTYIIKLLKEVGAKEVHVRISSPPYRFPCYFGIDTSARGELIAANNTVEETRKIIGADSLHYLSQSALTRILAERGVQLCEACFDGNYPVRLSNNPLGKSALERRK
ncbi:MAG TPA: amidophosphoribosyltransferase [Bacillota bacterium]|nr:amidophosphoribosyltransferase [Bacillota bacterium]